MPVISVVVTTYNRKELLGETLRSVLNQSFSDIEVIVVDNFSNYDFLDYISSFGDNRIKAFQNQNQGVIAVNRNIGIKHATGTYLAFCDDDDVWLPDKLEKQIRHLNDQSLREGNILVYSNTRYFGDRIKPRTSRKKKINNISDLIRINQLSLSTVLVTRTGEVQFDEDPQLVAVEDYYLWMTLMLRGTVFYFIQDVLVNYRINPNSQLREAAAYTHLKMAYAILKLTIKEKPKLILFLLIMTLMKQLFKFVMKQVLYTLKTKLSY